MTPREAAEVRAANDVGGRPIVFVHGLWVLAESWLPWREYAEQRGHPTIAVDWPGDPTSVEDARRDPRTFIGQSIGTAAHHLAEVVAGLSTPPVLIGHSFGGQLAEIVAGRGVAAATVSIDRAPGRGILPLPAATLRSSYPVLGNPLNVRRAVTLTYPQFRYSFANAVSEAEARDLYDAHHVAAPGLPFFQAAVANLNPVSETRTDVRNRDRGPMLLIAATEDHTAPPAIARAAYRRQRLNPAPTEFVEMSGRGHSLVFDSGWRDVADTALAFLSEQRLVARGATPR
jgi:pimeloyl-ACP methyl ester carboxylesterase